PTGAIIIVLDRFIPESPRFLVNMGLNVEARAVLKKYAGEFDHEDAGHPAPKEQHGGVRELLTGPHAFVSLALIVCGLAWGLVNFGFMLWLPANLNSMKMDAGAARGLLAYSALFAVPGTAVVTWLYHSWNSIRTLILFIVLCCASLLSFFALSRLGILNTATIVAATASLLVSSSGVIATLIPYAAEIYPVHLRATGSGIIAASSKFGGILGAIGGVCGLLTDMNMSSLMIALPMILSAAMLTKCGIDTRGRDFDDIQRAIAARGAVE
ncbi:MAG TPA: MFS transporter, partial [Burkholderiaceae bacterium]